MPHVPLFPSYRFKGTSRRGLYGDVIEEIDTSVGKILVRLKELDLDERTLVIFTSGNGPWLEYGIDGGSAGPLRAGKSTPYEGGVRVPCIMRWPGRIPAGQVTAEVASNMDLLPTLAKLAGTRAPIDRVIDGADIWPIVAGEAGAKSPHEEFYYFMGRNGSGEPNLKAVRSGEWKLHVEAAGDNLRGIELYDLAGDVGESRNLLDREPEVVERLEKKAQGFLDGLRKNSRPLGRLAQDQ
jgi:arylsulfatase A-like enzyme